MMTVGGVGHLKDNLPGSYCNIQKLKTPVKTSGTTPPEYDVDCNLDDPPCKPWMGAKSNTLNDRGNPYEAER